MRSLIAIICQVSVSGLLELRYIPGLTAKINQENALWKSDHTTTNPSQLCITYYRATMSSSAVAKKPEEQVAQPAAGQSMQASEQSASASASVGISISTAYAQSTLTDHGLLGWSQSQSCRGCHWLVLKQK